MSADQAANEATPEAAPSPICPKCGAAMEQGRLAGYKWISFNSDSERYKPVGKGERIIAFRCLKCSYVELYADEPHFWRPR